MNQLEKDFTYRLDAVKTVCNNYGFESMECKNSIEIWERQHSMNEISFIFSLMITGFVLITLIIYLIFWLYTKFLLNNKTENNE